MIQWFNDLLLITKLRLITESILFWTYLILIITQKASLNIFYSDPIIIKSGEAFYFLNLLLFIICLCSFIIRLFSIIYMLFFGSRKKTKNFSNSKIAYLFLANVYIEEYYDNYWYYPVLIGFYVFHLFCFEVPFCALVALFSKCIQNNKNDKLYYYKKYSFSYKSKSFNAQDF